MKKGYNHPKELFVLNNFSMETMPKNFEDLLIGVEGTQTPVGDSGKAETPQELALRLSVAPRKAKCLQRKSTAPINK
ncbi:hypothetical protein FZD47_22230 [Bacillus infantis]|uniref:Uncharacterized protein n=1 Tax=Bacillus infantis TaxID=324767 RepID=A0A5D4S876_9BACI|nr:hypothetical protein FZD47_22230 [Bacillus infantis]